MAEGDVVLARPKTRRDGFGNDLAYRVERYKVMKQCGAMTERMVGMLGEFADNPKFSASFRRLCALDILAYAIGAPARQIFVDAQNTEMQYSKIVHEVRWLPPDPLRCATSRLS
jgi:hypothetical protein